MPQLFTLFSDFNCPFCYALHERLDEMGVMNRIAWRGVQHAPYLSAPMVPWRGRLGAELRREVEVVHRLAPALPINLPGGKPNTGRAIALAARAIKLASMQAPALIRTLYRVFWTEGCDLSDPAELEGALVRAGLADTELLGDRALDVTSEVAQWEQDWKETGHAAVPLLVRGDGEQVVGLAKVEQLEQFIL